VCVLEESYLLTSEEHLSQVLTYTEIYITCRLR